MKNWYNLLRSSVYLFAFLGVLLIPFPFYLLGFQEKIAPFLFTNVVSWLSERLFHTSLNPPAFTSDTLALGALFIVLAALAVGIALLLQLVKRLRQQQQPLVIICRIAACYYLSLQLLKYGFDKLFKAQFYLPEPNILYTPVGQLGKDMLFWTTMGTSWSFNVFMGLMELLPAVLLMFKRTRVVGLLLATAVLLPVVMLNISFDISVKLFSMFLLFLSILLLSPFFKPLYAFAIQQKKAFLTQECWLLPFEIPVFIRVALKSFVIGLLLLEGLYPYLLSGNFNDDRALRPALHGAYAVTSIIAPGDTLPQPLPVKRVFIHRKGYIIFQDAHDGMQDFKLSVNERKGLLELTDYELHTTLLEYRVQPVDSLFSMQFEYQGRSYWLQAKRLSWEKLPVLEGK